MVLLWVCFACILYLACFHPFIHLPSSELNQGPALQQVLSANIHNIRARISQHIEIEAEQCLFSNNVMTFHDVYLTDHLAGSFRAQQIRWEMGSDDILCTGLIEGNLHEKRIAVQSSSATYHMKSGVLQWGDQTHWQAESV